MLLLLFTSLALAAAPKVQSTMANILLQAPSGSQQVTTGGLAFPVDGNGNVSVPSSLVPALLAAGCNYVFVCTEMAYFCAPVAQDLTTIVAAAAPVSGTPMTVAAQPAYACKLRVNGVYSGAVAGLVVNIVGVDGRGNAVTESVNVAAASSTTFLTANAFAKVTSVTPVGTVTNVTTIGVGQSGALALRLSPQFTGLTVYKSARAATSAGPMTDDGAGTVDTVAGTFTPTTAPTGVICYSVSYSWNQVA